MFVKFALWPLLALTFFGVGYSFLRRQKALDPNSEEARRAQRILDIMSVGTRQALDDSIMKEKQADMIKTLRNEFGLNLHEALDVIQLAKAVQNGSHA